MITDLAFAITRRFAPREGYLLWGGVLSAVACLGAAFADVGWVAGGEVLMVLTCGAAIYAGWLAKRAMDWRPGSILLLLTGAVLSITIAARAFPSPGYTGYTLGRVPGWLVRVLSGSPESFPLTPLFQHMAGRITLFVSHVQLWATSVAAGGALQDDAIFLMIALFLGWLPAAWAGWMFVRRQDAWGALVPTGVFLAIQTFFADEGFFWLVSFIGLLLAVSIAAAHSKRELTWQQSGVDYSPEIRLDLALTGSALILGIVITAVIVPGISYQGTVDLFWKIFAEPWRSIEKTGQRLFPDLGHQARSPLGGGLWYASGTGLPRSHLLGGAPDLSKRKVMRVKLRAAPDDLRGVWALYWRGLTYAQYNGRGWVNEPLPDPVTIGPGESWTPTRSLGRRELLQTIEAVNAGGVIFAAAEPLGVDVSVQARAYDAEGLLALELQGQRTSRYAVVSLVPTVSEDALRVVGGIYPVGVQERYLQLPQLSERVISLARELTVDIKNPYDKALALERYLRTIPYSLDVPLPPADQDVVDWFLFDLRKGYCDYYATAFVVMARAVGLPARLAIGYVSGTYDAKNDVYNVVEADAHSWPEVYFPHYGWLPFEPTGGRSTLLRSAQEPAGGAIPFQIPIDTTLLDLSKLASQRAEQAARTASQRALVINFGLAVLILAGFVWLIRRQNRRLTPAETVTLLWAKVERWGARLGRRPRGAETPNEYAAVLSQRWSRPDRAQGDEAQYLARAFTALRYGRDKPGEPERRQALTQWQRLQEQWRQTYFRRFLWWRKKR